MPKIDTVKDAMVRFRVSPAVLVQIERAAKAGGQTVSEWLRGLVAEALRA